MRREFGVESRASLRRIARARRFSALLHPLEGEVRKAG
jgi:hypothetical protein